MELTIKIIIKKLFLALFFLLFVSCGSDTTDRTTDTGSPKEATPYYFWKVEKQGKVSYWLGTIHLGVSLFELPCQHVITEKIKNSDVCFVESTASGDTQDQQNPLLSPNGEDFKQLDFSSQSFLSRKGLPDNLNFLGCRS